MDVMSDVLINLFGILLYSSGLLVWPCCWLLWRNEKRRTVALQWVFLGELGCQLVLLGFLMFSHGLLAQAYSWLFLMILVNLLFTPLAIGAAIYDYISASWTNDD